MGATGLRGLQNRDLYGSACGFRSTLFYDSPLSMLLLIGSKARIVKVGDGGSTKIWRETCRCRAGTRFCAEGRSVRSTHPGTTPSSLRLSHNIMSNCIIAGYWSRTRLRSQARPRETWCLYYHGDIKRSCPSLFCDSPSYCKCTLVTGESP